MQRSGRVHPLRQVQAQPLRDNCPTLRSRDTLCRQLQDPPGAHQQVSPVEVQFPSSSSQADPRKQGSKAVELSTTQSSASGTLSDPSDPSDTRSEQSDSQQGGSCTTESRTARCTSSIPADAHMHRSHSDARSTAMHAPEASGQHYSNPTRTGVRLQAPQTCA